MAFMSIVRQERTLSFSLVKCSPFPFSAARFHDAYAAVLSTDDACLLVAVSGEEVVGYLLGFCHRTFYANGPVGWVEEILVRSGLRGRGVGRALMRMFEQWATRRNCILAALATRFAPPHHHGRWSITNVAVDVAAGVVALSFSLYVVYLLEIVKLANPRARRREAERNAA